MGEQRPREFIPCTIGTCDPQATNISSRQHPILPCNQCICRLCGVVEEERLSPSQIRQYRYLAHVGASQHRRRRAGMQVHRAVSFSPCCCECNCASDRGCCRSSWNLLLRTPALFGRGIDVALLREARDDGSDWSCGLGATCKCRPLVIGFVERESRGTSVRSPMSFTPRRHGHPDNEGTATRQKAQHGLRGMWQFLSMIMPPQPKRHRRGQKEV